ncbi:hypothetical protein EYZ11_010859 [Aspergillus tanneri]|uniref:F-box domain-containing protein n=1 Tax=Aspergillus tanneri TaxID=1220188 RepID=A0A4V3UN41_9EURO|nr:uncharacterized protein ATNIH1004_001868 [Aspergillus tanneri]KAA8641403.1 hypothetical protein ATNIH1004_001868 [Aspergillus tanneri]THC89694.1 hypothetical protein EYZ11_010859 [Aspergillus tanneri]
MKYLSIGSRPDKESLHQILQKVTDLPDLHRLKVCRSQPVVWRHDWNFQNLLCLEIKGVGCEQGTLNLPSFPALLDLRISFGEEFELPPAKKFHVYVDLSRLPSLSALEIEGVLDEEIDDRLTFRGVTKSLQRFTAKYMNGWLFWDNWKCMNESLKDIRLQTSRESNCCPTELNFPRLKTLELENSVDCLPLNIGLPVLNQINLKLGPADFYSLSLHLSSPISVLQKLPITLNLIHDEIFDTDWQTTLDSEELETLAQLISRSNVRLGEDEKLILEMLSP